MFIFSLLITTQMNRDDSYQHNKSRHRNRQSGRDHQRNHHHHHHQHHGHQHYNRDNSPHQQNRANLKTDNTDQTIVTNPVAPFINPGQMQFNPLVQQFPPLFDPSIQQQHHLFLDPPHLQPPPFSSPNNPYRGMINTNIQPMPPNSCSLNAINIDPSRWHEPPKQSNYGLSKMLLQQTSAHDQATISKAVSDEAMMRLKLPPDQITENGIIPSAPYYELPASLIVPLIPSNQTEYKPLNPSDLRLPLPKYPDEDFMKTIDAYYGSDGKIRDNDGWDRQFIDTFVNQKRALSES